MITRSGVLDSNVSDHEMIYVIRRKPKIVPLSCQFSGCLHRNYNKDDFVQRTVQRTKTCMTNITDPNTLWSIFQDNIINMCAP